MTNASSPLHWFRELTTNSKLATEHIRQSLLLGAVAVLSYAPVDLIKFLVNIVLLDLARESANVRKIAYRNYVFIVQRRGRA